MRNFTFSVLDKLNLQVRKIFCFVVMNSNFFQKKNIFPFFWFLAGNNQTFSRHFLSQKFINNQLLAVMLEANPSFQTKVQKDVTFLLFWATYHFLKQKLAVQENRKWKKQTNLIIEKTTTPQISTLTAFQKNQLRNKNFHWQNLIWVIVFCKIINLCFLVFFWETRLRLKENNSTSSL